MGPLPVPIIHTKISSASDSGVLQYTTKHQFEQMETGCKEVKDKSSTLLYNSN